MGIAGEGLARFAHAARPIVEGHLQAALGDDWRQRSGLWARTGEPSAEHSLDDPKEILDQILRDEVWRSIAGTLESRRSSALRSMVYSLKDLRNRSAHTQAFEAPDAVRLLDECRSVLADLGALEPGIAAELDALDRRAGALLAGDSVEELTTMRGAWVESLMAATSHLDMGGISAAADARMVRITLSDIFVAPAFEEPEPEPLDETHAAVNMMFRDSDPTIDVATLLDRQRLAILGSPGAGKSTLLRYLARRAILDTEGAQQTPIIIGASAFARTLEMEPATNLLRYLVHRFRPRFGVLFQHEIREGRAWLLIDGLDEVGDTHARRGVLAAIDAFCADQPGLRVWLTSRPIGFDLGPAGPRFSVAEIAPFDDDRIRAFADGWTRTVTLGQPRPGLGLAEEILRSEQLTDLARTPLLLTILALLWQRGSRLPDRRVELFQSATDTLLRDWPLHRQGTELDMPMVLDILQPVAMHILSSGESTIGERDLFRIVTTAVARLDDSPPTEARRAGRRLLQMIHDTTGFFIADGRDGEGVVYRFIHRTFAEYLAARFLLDEWASGTLDLRSYLHRPEWATAIELLFEHASSISSETATGLLNELLGLGPLERHLHGSLRMALAALSRGVRPSLEIREQIVGQALEVYLRPDTLDPALDLDLAELLAASLRHHTASATAASLREAAADDDPVRTRKAILRLLINATDRGLSAALAELPTISRLSRNPDRDLRRVLVSLAPEASATTQSLLVLSPTVRLSIPEAGTHQLGRIGVPTLSPVDVRPFLEGSVEDHPPFIVFVDDTNMSVSDLVELHRSSHPWWLGTVTWPVGEWHDQHEHEIRGLASIAHELPASMAASAAVTYYMDDADAWLPVLEAMIARGDDATKVAALEAIFDLEVGEDLANLAIDRVMTQQPELLGTLVECFGRLYEWPDLIFAAARQMLDATDPRTRGAARRLLAPRLGGTMALSLLSEESAFDPIVRADGSPSPVEPGVTERLVETLLLLDTFSLDIELHARLRMTLGRVLERAPTPPEQFDYGLGEGSQRPTAEALARSAALDDRAETRAWAASLLIFLDRAEASQELKALLLDPAPVVRAKAAEAVQAQDLQEPSWIIEILPQFLTVANESTASRLAQTLRDELDAARVQDVAETLELCLDEQPMPAAIAFATVFLLYEPWRGRGRDG